MGKLKTIDMSVVERVSFFGPENNRKEHTEIMVAFPEEYLAVGWLEKHLEDEYGWSMLRYKVVPEPDGNRVRVTEIQRDDRPYHVYTIKESTLLVEDKGS
jgi:hypothetical protein